jgi:hypothetical protein
MLHPFRYPPAAAALLALVGFALAAAPSHAGERRFTYVYEATTAPKGTLELENWVTWRANRTDTNRSDRFDFRHELEFGVTDRFQVALYVADWRLTDDADHDRHVRYHDTALEAIYNLSNPVTDWIGSALYGEVKVGDRFLELEGKVILQKNFGPWIVAYNATIEAEYEGAHLDERTGEFAQSAGVSYQVIPQLTVGAEVLHEIEFPDWEEAEDSVVYAGPNVSFRQGNAFATLTPMIQITDIDGEPDVQTRLIFGVHF